MSIIVRQHDRDSPKVAVTGDDLSAFLAHLPGIRTHQQSRRDRGKVLHLQICFVLPLILILLIVTFAGERSNRILAAARGFLERRWPHIVACLVFIVGLFALLFGATGLAAGTHGRVGRFFRHFRRSLPHLRP